MSVSAMGRTGWAADALFPDDSPEGVTSVDPLEVWRTASAAIRRAEREIDHLWRASILVDDGPDSRRLADISHVLRRAAWLARHAGAIG
jgi:hypothetical protein